MSPKFTVVAVTLWFWMIYFVLILYRLRLIPLEGSATKPPAGYAGHLYIWGGHPRISMTPLMLRQSDLMGLSVYLGEKVFEVRVSPDELKKLASLMPSDARALFTMPPAFKDFVWISAFAKVCNLQLFGLENMYFDRKRDLAWELLFRKASAVCLDMSGNRRSNWPPYSSFNLTAPGPYFHNKPYPWPRLGGATLASRPILLGHVGAIYGLRALHIDELLAGGFEVSCRGGHYYEDEFRPGASKYKTSTVVNESEYWSLMFDTRISLNWGNTDEYPENLYGYAQDAMMFKDRCFDSMCAGSLTLFNEQEATRRLFTPGVHYVFFESVGDIAAIVKRTIEQPEWAQAIASAGFQRARELQSDGGLWRRYDEDARKFSLSLLRNT